MNNYVITCCSTADMPASYFEEKKVPYACFHFLLDGKEYPDDLGEINFFSRLLSDDRRWSSAHYGSGQYGAIYKPV